MLTISYHAQEQMKRLSPQERLELDHILENSDKLQQTQKIEPSGKFVSRFGQNMRVVWQKTNSGDIIVLTVISK